MGRPARQESLFQPFNSLYADRFSCRFSRFSFARVGGTLVNQHDATLRHTAKVRVATWPFLCSTFDPVFSSRLRSSTDSCKHVGVIHVVVVVSGPMGKTFETTWRSKPSIKNRPKYSDDASYRIRQKVHFSSERLRSLLRKIDRFLAVTTEQRLHRLRQESLGKGNEM